MPYNNFTNQLSNVQLLTFSLLMPKVLNESTKNPKSNKISFST